tara:strand:- start:782 stop:910 length:129 start_codon:yes stop_codon:yes gene_type:complete
VLALYSIFLKKTLFKQQNGCVLPLFWHKAVRFLEATPLPEVK